jgi:hypothetical protein
MDVVWLLAGFGVGAFGMWAYLAAQKGGIPNPLSGNTTDPKYDPNSPLYAPDPTKETNDFLNAP